MKKTYTPEEKKNLRHLFWRSGHFWATFNMVKMMGQTYAFCLFPILNEVYAGKEDLRREAMLRNTEFFNCNASMSGLCLGVSYAAGKRAGGQSGFRLAADDYQHQDVPDGTAGSDRRFPVLQLHPRHFRRHRHRAGLAGQSIRRRVVRGDLRRSVSGAEMDADKLGYGLGTNVITEAFHSGIIGMITQSACIMGLMMVGALVAQMVSVQIPLVVPMGGGAEMVVQTIFDEIMPGLLELGLLFGIVALLKRKWKPITVIALILVMAITGSFFGIF